MIQTDLLIWKTNDIHPNEAGYRVIANQFFSNYSIPVNGNFPNSSGEWGSKLDKTELVAPDKKWTVTLNTDLDPASIHGSIFVVKDATQLMNIALEVFKDNSKQIFVIASKQGYKSGSYQLSITNKLTDTTGT